MAAYTRTDTVVGERRLIGRRGRRGDNQNQREVEALTEEPTE
jgi:hypothetical protein